jgi:site-specific DNA-methyltransferase (adenine-specific)
MANPDPRPPVRGAGEAMMPMYDRANIALFNAEWQQVLPTIPDGSIDLAICDPPYNTTNLEWDERVDLPALWAELNRVCTPSALQVFFSAQPFTTDLILSNRARYRYELIWRKTMGTGFLDANRRPLRAHENLIVFCERFGESVYRPQKFAAPLRKVNRSRYDSSVAAHYGAYVPRNDDGDITSRYPLDVLDFPSVGNFSGRLHPTQKPLSLLEWLISSYSNPGMTILDPYCGSGPSLVAARKLGRKAIGVERRADYCRLIVDRLAQDVLNLECVS